MRREIAQWCDDATDHFFETYSGVLMVCVGVIMAVLLVALIVGIAMKVFGNGGPSCAPGTRLGAATSREMRTVMIGKTATLQPVDVTVQLCVSE